MMQIQRTWTIGRTLQRGRSIFFICFVLLCGSITHSVALADDNTSTQSSSPLTAYSSAREITQSGTVQQVISGKAGISLLVDGPQGVFDANLGSALPRQVQQSLSNGQQIQLIGVTQTANGKQYLLVRQMTVSGREITVRNKYGLPVRTRSNSASPSAITNYSATQGGAK
jgi:hypothetical protein